MPRMRRRLPRRARLVEQYGDDVPVSLHAQARPAEACMTASQRAVDILVNSAPVCTYCIFPQHRSLSLLSAGKVTDKRITAETCPHYLLFTADDLERENGCMLKCNPAIKSAADRAALLDAVAGGLIDTVATDHAPHLFEEKQGSLFKAASGMPGVRFMLVEMLSLASRADNNLTVEKVVELTAHNPATLYAIEKRGFIRPGYYADLVVAEAAEPYTPAIGEYLPAGMMSPCNWTPYAFTQVNHRIAATYVNGALAFDGSRVRQVETQALRFGVD